jgi:hypothetical protein
VPKPTLADLDPRYGNDAAPGQPGPALWTVLEQLELVGGSADVTIGYESARQMIYRYRKKFGREKKFILRQLEPGKCRIWRTQ